jgi:hypothetical protein
MDQKPALIEALQTSRAAMVAQLDEIDRNPRHARPGRLQRGNPRHPRRAGLRRHLQGVS